MNAKEIMEYTIKQLKIAYSDIEFTERELLLMEMAVNNAEKILKTGRC